MVKAEEAGEGEGISLRFAILLAVGLVVLVMALNQVGSTEVPIGLEHLKRLDAEDLVQSVEIAPGGWHVTLRRPSRIDNGSGELITRQVVVREQGEPGAEQARGWRSRGVRVERISEPEPENGWLGGVLVSGLLGLGVWHLWQQMQKHRREGSPRQHLERLEQEFKDGKITQEEYQLRAELIMAEM
ncbi:MAG: hypothetical protein FJY95_20910 [Candidatus Handelsmanbacteria bacterium]|nr:hypothetical protein [Candidatus Handelsmanbacteria bacterium]